MVPGIFQSKPEFDKYDGQIRRNYLGIDGNGQAYLANLPDSPSPTIDAITHAANCLKASSHFSGMAARLQFERDEIALTLVLHLDGDSIQVTDPQQDDLGGFGGTYARLKHR